MNQKLFVLNDVKSGTYTAPTVHLSRGQALRDFGDAINGNPDTLLAKHPEDFTLFEIGEYDVYTGTIILHDAKEAVANGLDLKISQ